MIDIEFCTDCEDRENIKELIELAARATMEHEGISAGVNITIVDEEEIRRINNDFRQIDRVTDVLSFPAWDGSDYDLSDNFLGDIAICLVRAGEQAVEYGHTLRREIAFLTVHGMLHIIGYDHVDSEDEKVMFALQDEILQKIDITR